MKLSNWTLWLGGSLVFALAGCGVSTETAAPEATPLGEVEIPADFAFETTQTVALDLEVAAHHFGDRVDAAVEITKPSGATVFRGAIKKGAALSVQIPVAKHVDHLDVTVRGANGPQTTAIEFVGGRASGRLE